MTDKITIDRETLQGAVDALDRYEHDTGVQDGVVVELRAALAAPPAPAQPAEPTLEKGMAQELMEWIECLPIPTRGASHWARRLHTFISQPAPAQRLSDDDIDTMARTYGVVYKNRHYPDDPAVAFSNGTLHLFARTIEAAIVPPGYVVVPVEPVEWQYRNFYSDDTSTPGWSEWERVTARNSYTSTVADRVAEIQSAIDRGAKAELRALYAAAKDKP